MATAEATELSERMHESGWEGRRVPQNDRPKVPNHEKITSITIVMHALSRLTLGRQTVACHQEGQVGPIRCLTFVIIMPRAFPDDRELSAVPTCDISGNA